MMNRENEMKSGFESACRSAPYELTNKQKRYLPIKRFLDVVLAGGASLVLLPFMLVLAIVIKLDSPGPVLFKQKRVGKNKRYFYIWKFRTMRTDTPKDMPTHLLKNPDTFITKTGRFLRKTSLDELPQLWQCVVGDLTLLGPRPALWNQYDLIEEREKYGANEVKPGVTGWAQINGRDELEISMKAKLDGEYVQMLNTIGWKADWKIFWRSFGAVLHARGVVEGSNVGVVKKGTVKK